MEGTVRRDVTEEHTAHRSLWLVLHTLLLAQPASYREHTCVPGRCAVRSQRASRVLFYFALLSHTP